ncbi:MAG: tape measure protein, partial [Erysipelotrichaceae bacterium]
MDLVKIGFLVTATGLKDANTQVDNLLTKADKISKKQFLLKLKLEKNLVFKQLKDLETLQKRVKDTNMKLSLTGYSQVKSNLEQIEKLRRSIKDVQIKLTTVGNVNKIKEDLKALKGKTINVNVTTTIVALDRLKAKLKALKNISLNITVKIPKVTDVERLSKAFDKLSSKKVKIEIKVTPELSVLKEYADTIARIRNTRSRTDINLGGNTGGSGSNSRSSGLLGQTLGIAKYAVLSAAIYGVITALGRLGTSFVETADDMQNLTQRLGIYLPVNIKVNDALKQMSEIAKENRVTLAATGKLFTQLLPPIQRIKGGVSETIAIVDAFGKAMLVGGANTQEAASATVQFGQAMASGKLAGDEFRSLAEASPRLLQAIADGAGIAAQKLKEMSAAGKLTSGLVSSALLDQFIQLEYEALKMGQTVSGAFNEGLVAYQNFVHSFNQQTGFTDSIVEGIRSIVKAFESLGSGLLSNLKDADSTLNSFLSMLKVIWDLLGSLVSGFIDVVGWIVKGGEKIGFWKATFDAVKTSLIVMTDALLKIPFVIVNIGTRLTELVLKPFEYFISLAQKGLNLAGFTKAADRLGEGLGNYRGAIKDIKGFTGEVVTGFDLLSLGVKKTEESTGSVSDIVDRLKQQNKDLVLQEKEKKAMTDSQYLSEYAKLLLEKEGVVANAENLKLVKEELQQRFDITQEQAKALKIQGEIQAKKDEAEKKAKEAADKAKKDAENELKRLEDVRKNYQDQIDIVERLNMFKAKGVSYDVAKIAAEKDYYDAYTDTAKALEVAEAKKALSRFDMLGDLENETLLLTKVLALQEQGVSYDVARSLAQAGFAANSEGLLAASQSMHNTLVAQQYSIADQIKQQTLLNYFLNQGLSLEEATVRASYARLENIQKAAGLKGLSTEQRKLRAETVSMQKQLEAKKALSDVEEKINALNRERTFLTAATRGVYTAATISAAKLLATTEGLLYTDAQRQLIRQEENDLLNERIKNQLSLNSLLSGESETLRDVKNTYLFITDEEAKRIEANRKLVTLAEAYASKMEQQKAIPIGDFSKVDFEVFGDFGNPFKEALDGLNALISGSTKLDESLAIIATQISDLKTQSFVEDMFGNQTAVESLNSQVEKQVALEQDLQKQKAETNDIAYGQGLKFAKSFFKEESKGYKIINALEMALQADKIAFKLWEKKDVITFNALKLKAYVTDTLGFTTGAYAKIVAQQALNVAQAQGAVASAAQAPPPVGFASAAAMIALLAGIGIAVGGGGSSGSFAPTNEGTGTVFGDSEAQSESIKNSMDLLSENSDL